MAGPAPTSLRITGTVTPGRSIPAAGYASAAPSDGTPIGAPHSGQRADDSRTSYPQDAQRPRERRMRLITWRHMNATVLPTGGVANTRTKNQCGSVIDQNGNGAENFA